MRRLRLVVVSALLVSGVSTSASAGTTGSPGPNQLYGHISSNRTLTAGSPGPNYEIIGDLTVDPGVTLTIDNGVTLVVTANSDYLATGSDRSKVEIVIRGSLQAPAGSPGVRIQSSILGGGTWYGLLVRDGGSITLANTRVEYPITGISVGAGSTATLTNCVFYGASISVFVEGGGSATLQGCEIHYGTGPRVTGNGDLRVFDTTMAAVGDGVYFGPSSTGDVARCDITGVGTGTGLLLPFSLTPADSLHPEPTYVNNFEHGVNCAAPNIALDHLIIDGCYVAVYDSYGGHRVNYCTFINNNVNMHYQGGEIYNSIVYGGSFYTVEHIDYVDWWNISGSAWNNVATGNQVSSYNPFFAVGDPRFHLNPASFFTNFSVSGGEIGAYGPGPVLPTPVLSASVVDAKGLGGVVRIRWHAETRGASKASIYRRDESGDWEPLEVLYPDGLGYVSLEDRDVEAGARYGYGVGFQRDGQIGIDGQVWVTVEEPIVGLSIASIEPNPATDAWSIALSAPESADGRIEVVDVGGRVVRGLDLGHQETGRRTVSVPARGLPPGVYWIRATHGGRSALAKAVKTN